MTFAEQLREAHIDGHMEAYKLEILRLWKGGDLSARVTARCLSKAKERAIASADSDPDRFIEESRQTAKELEAQHLMTAEESADYILYPGAKEAIEALSRTHRLGSISDTRPSIENQLCILGVLQYCSFAAYSFALGVFKPDPRMYLDALRQCGRDARECVFADDSPENPEGAAKLGITPILIAANPASDLETPYRKIYSLSELL